MNLSKMELCLDVFKTLSPHIDLLKISVLKVDFLQINFLLSPPLSFLETRSCIANLTLIEWC